MCVEDNGCGMDEAELQQYARLGLSQEARGIVNHTAATAQFNYVNGAIGRFGVGGKQAGFYLGNELIVTSCDGQFVRELRLSEVTKKHTSS